MFVCNFFDIVVVVGFIDFVVGFFFFFDVVVVGFFFFFIDFKKYLEWSGVEWSG